MSQSGGARAHMCLCDFEAVLCPEKKKSLGKTNELVELGLQSQGLGFKSLDYGAL